MSTERISARPRRVGTPLLTLLAVAAIAAGVATGLQSLYSAANAGAVAAAPAPMPAINDAANIVTHPRPTPPVAAQACQAMDSTAKGMYCGSPHGAKVTGPRAAWQACEAMDVTAYGQYCLPGDGGRWIEGSARDRE